MRLNYQLQRVDYVTIEDLMKVCCVLRETRKRRPAAGVPDNRGGGSSEFLNKSCLFCNMCPHLLTLPG